MGNLAYEYEEPLFAQPMTVPEPEVDDGYEEPLFVTSDGYEEPIGGSDDPSRTVEVETGDFIDLNSVMRLKVILVLLS